MILSLIVIAPLFQILTQNRDSLIQLYPGMEDTINYIDRSYLGLYKQIEGYEYSSVFIRNEEQLISRITFSENGTLKDTVLVNDLSVLGNTRLKIKQIENENDKKIKSLHQVAVITNGQEKYEGLLEGISKDYLYLHEDKNIPTNKDSKLNFRIPLSKIDQVLIRGESNYLKPVLWGTGIGFATGVLALIGFSVLAQESLHPDSEPQVKLGSELIASGFVCAIIGAGIGYIIGWLSAEKDVSVRFDSERSVLGLKDYAPYNFQYLNALNENYDEIK